MIAVNKHFLGHLRSPQAGCCLRSAIDPDSDACIFYTSGTTGRPKGAQLTHRGCVANVLNVAAMGGIYASHRALEAGTVLETPASAPPPVALIATPLFHVTANNCIMQAGTVAGGRFILDV